jgi:hypothetical protein
MDDGAAGPPDLSEESAGLVCGEKSAPRDAFTAVQADLAVKQIMEIFPVSPKLATGLARQYIPFLPKSHQRAVKAFFDDLKKTRKVDG